MEPTMKYEKALLLSALLVRYPEKSGTWSGWLACSLRDDDEK
jgi:hypothetical protein